MPPLPGLGSAIQDLNRLREIAAILTKHGFGFLVSQLQLGAYLPAKARVTRPPKPKVGVPARLRQTLEELGPTFIKLGQVLSMRPDLLPSAYVQELSKLQDRVAPFNQPAPQALIRGELGAPVARLFKSFQAKPLAAASIAQVHRAVTRDGRQVVVKLQRPDLRRRVESDLQIIRFLARAWEKIQPEALPRRPVEFVDEFEQLIQAELDFLREGRNLERLARNFKDRPGYQFAKVYWNLSTPRCLTLEFIPGRKLGQALPGLSADRRKQLAQNLIDAYIYMALEDRFFHADPHAGNFLLTPAGKLAFIDAGQVGRLDSETVAAFTDMLLALANQDTEALVDAYLRLGTAEEGLDRRSLARDAALFMEQYYDLPVARISVGSSLQEVVELSLKHRIQLPADFVVLVKTFLGAEGMARRLNPKLNLVEAAQPMATSIMRRRYEPRQLAERAVRQMQDLRRFMSSLPARLQDLLDKLQRGHFKMEFEHKGLEDLRYDLDRTGNRLSVALVVAALIMGSAWILASQIGPQWGGFSVLGLAGFVLAGVFGLLLILAILRSGRM